MRILYILAFLVTSCSAQQNSNPPVAIDTAKLLNPMQEPDDSFPEGMFKNFVLLNQHPFVLTVQGKQSTPKSYEELFNHFKTNKAAIHQSRFYILVDSSVAFSNIVTVINNLKELAIGNYRVINMDSHLKTAEPLTVNEPTTTIKTTNAHDSGYFSITILNGSYKASILNRTQTLKNSSGIEQFIKDNKTLINPAKILIIGKAGTTYAEFKPVIQVFKKYEFYNFQMVTQ